MLSLIDKFTEYTPDELKVYIYLDHRSQQNYIKTGLTLTELARQTNLGREAAYRAVTGLQGFNTISLEETKRKNVYRLLMNVVLDEDAIYYPIPFTFDNTDETKLAILEKELLRMRQQYENDLLGQQSNLRNYLKGDERELIIAIEGDLKRGLSSIECYLLGKLMSSFGPERVRKTWIGRAHAAKNPIPALSAMLWNGVAGKGAKQREETKQVERTWEILQ